MFLQTEQCQDIQVLLQFKLFTFWVCSWNSKNFITWASEIHLSFYFTERNKFVKNPSSGETDGDQVTMDKGTNGDQMVVDGDTEVQVGEAVPSGDCIALTHTEPQ